MSSQIDLYGCLIHPLRSFASDSLSKLPLHRSECFKEDSKFALWGGGYCKRTIALLFKEQ